MSRKRWVESRIGPLQLNDRDGDVGEVANATQVQWAVQNEVKFVSQSGGHGWTTTWNIGESDIIINMRGMNKIAVNLKEGHAIIEGGALVHEVIDAAYAEKAHVGRFSDDTFR
jgi:FAD/FMN-containing dehydrogenase